MSITIKWRHFAGSQTVHPRDRLIKALLWPLSVLFGGCVCVRKILFKRGVFKAYRSSKPIVSIGNLSVGGEGKTPFTDYLCRLMERQGKYLGLVSRGYGRGSKETYRVPCDATPQNVELYGDEPVLLARRNPQAAVFVATPKRLGVQKAEQEGVDVVVLDDGFQHLAVERDLDVLLLNGVAPFGNGSLLPAGILREPVSAIERADVLVLSQENSTLKQELTGRFKKPVFEIKRELEPMGYTLSGEPFPVSALKQERVFVFSGIAKPEPFFAMVRSWGCEMDGTLALPDHVGYNEAHYREIQHLARTSNILVTTEKDATKLNAGSFDKTCVVVPLRLSLSGEEEFLALVERALEMKNGIG